MQLGHFIDTLEDLLGVKAMRRYEPIQPGDVERTYADMASLERDFGFRPRVPIEDGLKKFADWYRSEWASHDR